MAPRGHQVLSEALSLSPDGVSSRVTGVSSRLIKTGSLHNGMTMREAEQILGPVTNLQDASATWLCDLHPAFASATPRLMQ